MSPLDPSEWPLVEHPLSGVVLLNGKPFRREFRASPFNGRVVEVLRPLPSRLFVSEFTNEAPSNDN